mgnify:CR=1 FL=1
MLSRFLHGFSKRFFYLTLEFAASGNFCGMMIERLETSIATLSTPQIQLAQVCFLHHVRDIIVDQTFIDLSPIDSSLFLTLISMVSCPLTASQVNEGYFSMKFVFLFEADLQNGM